jgi:hypothetical protein
MCKQAEEEVGSNSLECLDQLSDQVRDSCGRRGGFGLNVAELVGKCVLRTFHS